MAITPSNQSVAVGASLELTSLLSGAIWTISNGAVGSLGTGSTAYKKLFTALAAGTATISVRGSVWYSPPSSGTAVRSDDSLITTTTGSYQFPTPLAKLTQPGDKVSVIYKANIGLLFRDNAAGYSMGVDFFGQIVGNGGGSFGSGVTDGSLLEFLMTAGNGMKLFINGVLKIDYSSLSFATNANQDLLFYIYYAVPVGTITGIPVYSGSGISGVPSESTTVTVFAPPSITTVSPLASVQAGNSFSRQLAVSGGSGSGAWSIIANDASQPVSIGSTGIVSGNGTTLGTINFTAKYIDSNSTYGTATKAFQINVTPPPPTFRTTSPLPYAQTTKSFSYQLQISGGSGSGSYSVLGGNLPAGALSASGLITIPNVGNGTYTAFVRYTDNNGTYVQDTFSIPVSEYAYIELRYQRPLKRTPILTTTEFEKIEGLPDVAEDAPLKYEYDLQILYNGRSKGETLRQFLYDHRLKTPFLWYNPDRNEVKTVYLNSSFPEEEMLAYGGFQVILKEV